jgi:signal transduction histidine kinase
MVLSLSSLKNRSRVSPGMWLVLIWFAFAVTSYAVSAQWRTDDLSVFGLQWGEQADEVVSGLIVVAAGRYWRRPLAAMCLLLIGTVVSVMATGIPLIPPLRFLAVDVAVCYLAATQPPRTSVKAGSLALATLLGYSGIRRLMGWDGYSRAVLTDDSLARAVLTAALATVVLWLVGHAVWRRRVHAEALRTQATQQAIVSERLRIARELHDMVAHNIGVVALQAGAARRVFDTQPARARVALEEVEAAGRETLAGMRRLLGVLREADESTADEAERPALIPGLDDVPGLAAGMTAAGVQVDVHWSGPRRRLPPEIELSAYRVVQEAVTNVARHAEVRSCQVSIEFLPTELAVEVVNTGRQHGTRSSGELHGPRAASEGQGAVRSHGLVGMRERINLLHGEFSAGPRPDGGFRVAVRLPVSADHPVLPRSASR